LHEVYPLASVLQIRSLPQA